jgi:predicted nucleic-acid-binding protein
MKIANRVILDTNAILRVILCGQEADTEQAKEVERLLSEKPCLATAEVIAETVFVLSSVYRLDRASVARVIKIFGAFQEGIIEESASILYALERFVDSKLGFIDCLLLGYAKIYKARCFTFDKDLKKALKRLDK